MSEKEHINQQSILNQHQETEEINLEQALIEEVEKDGQLNAYRIQLIQSTWESVRSLGEETVGLLLYKNIFTLAPDALQLFSFRDVEDLYNSQQLKKHAKMVVTLVGVVIDNLNSLQNVVQTLKDLGKTHVKYGVKPEHYPVVGQALLLTLETGLGEVFTPQVRYAYEVAYQVIQDTLIQGAEYDAPEVSEKELDDFLNEQAYEIYNNENNPNVLDTFEEENAILNDIQKENSQLDQQEELNDLEQELQNYYQQNPDQQNDNDKIDGSQGDRTSLDENELQKELYLYDDQDHQEHDLADPSDDFADIVELDNLKDPATVYDDTLQDGSINAITVRDNEHTIRVAEAVADYQKK